MADDPQEIRNTFLRDLGDFGDYQWLIDNRPLLAHYTSMHALEQIIKNEEIWFSNPLFMNDLEEMRFGINEGARLFETSSQVADACGTQERLSRVRDAFRHYYNHFSSEHAIDVFVFCLSLHDSDDTDGVLSMWRAYGRHGDGAALVFNTNFIVPRWDSPLVVAKVTYASTEQRIASLNERLGKWCEILKTLSLRDNELHVAAYTLFELLKLYALTTKHRGFSEEHEWRIIYLPDRDPAGVLKDKLSYVIGQRGVEPKLKLQIKPLPHLKPAEQWTLETILDRIILGPSVSSPLARTSVGRMLDSMGKSSFKDKVCPSSIPLRPL